MASAVAHGSIPTHPPDFTIQTVMQAACAMTDVINLQEKRIAKRNNDRPDLGIYYC